MSQETFSLLYHSMLICFDCSSVMMYCISNEASIRGKQFLCFNNSRFQGENVPGKIYSSPFVACPFVLSKVVTLGHSIYCFCNNQ